MNRETSNNHFLKTFLQQESAGGLLLVGLELKKAFLAGELADKRDISFHGLTWR